MWIEINLVLYGGIENDLILGCGSIALSFGSAVEINLIFCVRDRTLLGFSVGVEGDFFLCGGSQLTGCEPKLICFML